MKLKLLKLYTQHFDNSNAQYKQCREGKNTYVYGNDMRLFEAITNDYGELILIQYFDKGK